MTLSFKALLLGTKIAATASLLATTAIAQTTTITPPQGMAVIVPDAALEEEASGGFINEADYPRFESLENYEAIGDTLVAQGFSDVTILREGPILTVTAQRGGVPIELVYSTANSRLVSVDGIETRPEVEMSSGGDIAGAATGDGTATGTDDGTDGDGSTDGSDGGADGSDADAGGDTDGADAGDGESGSDSDSDGGSEGGTNG